MLFVNVSILGEDKLIQQELWWSIIHIRLRSFFLSWSLLVDSLHVLQSFSRISTQGFQLFSLIFHKLFKALWHHVKHSTAHILMSHKAWRTRYSTNDLTRFSKWSTKKPSVRRLFFNKQQYLATFSSFYPSFFFIPQNFLRIFCEVFMAKCHEDK